MRLPLLVATALLLLPSCRTSALDPIGRKRGVALAAEKDPARHEFLETSLAWWKALLAEHAR